MRHRRDKRWAWAGLALAVAALWGAPANGQEVQWRHDYTAARREAAATGRPLLIDVGTRYCFYCRRLDATTFRDPAVVGVMNQAFIPLKIDADHDPALADALGVQGYPTLVLAGPNGTIVDVLSGYVDAAHFGGHLRVALAAAHVEVRRPDLVAPAAGSRSGALYLTLADAWLEEGARQQAVFCLERAVQSSPGSPQAELAQVRLTQLRSQRTP